MARAAGDQGQLVMRLSEVPDFAIPLAHTELAVDSIREAVALAVDLDSPTRIMGARTLPCPLVLQAADRAAAGISVARQKNR